MTKREDQIRAKAERLAATKAPATAADQERHLSAAAPVQVKDVRQTVDLSPTQHKDLAAWCVETAETIGSTRVTRQAVLRALVGRLLTDETLARKIRDDLRGDSR